jgi:hypothetical protein
MRRTMSATKQQQRTAREAGIIGQIKFNAEFIGRDANELASEMFGRELDQISEDQGWTMLRRVGALADAKREAIRVALTPVSGPHSHGCITCGLPVHCHLDNCRELVGEHRWCHEGYTQREWINYHRRLEMIRY